MEVLLLSEVNGEKTIFYESRHGSLRFLGPTKELQSNLQNKESGFRPSCGGDTLHLIRKWRFMSSSKHFMASKYFSFKQLSKEQVKYDSLIMFGLSNNLF